MPYEILDAAPTGRYQVLDDAAPSFLSDPIGYAKSDMQAIPGRLGNLAAGAVRGAGSIGATLLYPWDKAQDIIQGDRGKNLGYLVTGKELPSRNEERRAAMTDALQSMGADPTSLQFGAGKLAAEIAGTAGVGGVLANGVRATGLTGPVIDAVASGLQTGGFRTGGQIPRLADAAIRVGTGAATGGATAGLVNPQDAGKGAVIGGALPVATMASGKAAQLVARAYQAATTPQEVKVAQNLARQLGVTADDLRGALTGPQMIPGYQPTVPQLLQDPTASQLQRTLQTAGQQGIADAGKVQQGQFRSALGSIAPLGTTVQDAAARAGGAIQDYAIPAQKAAGANVNALFDAIPSEQARMQLPLQAMQDAQTKFLGPGTFGKGGASAEQAINAATKIGMDTPTLTAKAVPFDQIQALRSSIGEAIGQAQANGQNQAAAALTTMKNAIDNKIADVAAGNARPGEVFTPQAIDAWGQALKAHADKVRQFGTGPQIGMFRMGADGQPAVQGAEIPGKFYNGNLSQVDDMQAFKRLIGNRDDLAQELKSYALTQGVSTETSAGNLGDKFINWMEGRSGANAQLFNQQEQATIKEVGRAVQRQMAAENLGRVSGPDTAQKLASLQSNGMLDSKVAELLGRRVPVLGHFTGPILDSLRASAAGARNQTMATLLANPQTFADTLGRAPGLLNFDPPALGMFTQGVYRASPLLGTQ
jgi:hypothetical protein